MLHLRICSSEKLFSKNLPADELEMHPQNSWNSERKQSLTQEKHQQRENLQPICSLLIQQTSWMIVPYDSVEQFYGTILCSVILFYDSVIQNESGGFLGATGLSTGVFNLSGLNSCSIY